MLLRSAVALATLVLTSSFAQAQQGQTLTGTIKEFSCGDNCYLTIRTEQGRDETALCEAKECVPWNEVSQMPANLVGRRIQVSVGSGVQFDGAGRRMGTMKSFRTIAFVNGAAPAPAPAPRAGMQTFNIYASVPDSDPKYPQKTDPVVRRLNVCGIEAQSDFTSRFQQLTQGLVIVYSGPYASVAAANVALEKAKACGFPGYSKQTRRSDGE